MGSFIQRSKTIVYEGGIGMENGFSARSLFMLTILVGLLIIPSLIFAKETVQEWELINPEGIVKIEPVELAPRLKTLEGKTVMLFGNGKPNSDRFLDRVGDLLTKQVKGIKILKNWEVAPETYMMSQHPDVSQKNAAKLAGFKPDIVIGSQCD
jgi:hypothetical protein